MLTMMAEKLKENDCAKELIVSKADDVTFPWPTGSVSFAFSAHDIFCQIVLYVLTYEIVLVKKLMV